MQPFNILMISEAPSPDWIKGFWADGPLVRCQELTHGTQKPASLVAPQLGQSVLAWRSYPAEENCTRGPVRRAGRGKRGSNRKPCPGQRFVPGQSKRVKLKGTLAKLSDRASSMPSERTQRGRLTRGTRRLFFPQMLLCETAAGLANASRPESPAIQKRRRRAADGRTTRESG